MTAATDPAREAAAAAVLEEVDPGQVIALGSGRAVWRVLEKMAERWSGRQLRVVVASTLTQDRAEMAGMEVLQLDGSIEPAVAIDGADEVGPGLALIKGGGGALLREKIVVASAARFVVVAETAKKVEHLGQGFKLPVEVVRFGWRDTARRLTAVLPGGELRGGEADPFITDEGHFIIDSPIPAGSDPEELAAELSMTPGVVEHGLFIGMATKAYLGTPEGEVEILEP